MESPFSTLVFVGFGLVIYFCAVLVESQSKDGATDLASHSPIIPPPPPPPQPPPPISPAPPEKPPPSHHSPNQLSSKNEPNRSPSPSRHRSPERAKYRRRLPPPPKHSKKIKTGKMIGLAFAGVAGILQIVVVGFLIFKRRQLLKFSGRYETCSWYHSFYICIYIVWDFY